MKLLKISKSDKPEKKYVAVFEKDNGKTKKTYFGQAGADDYTITKDKERRRLYRERHQKDLSTNDPTRAGHLAFFLLWGDSTSLNENIKNYKKKFNL